MQLATICLGGGTKEFFWIGQRTAFGGQLLTLYECRKMMKAFKIVFVRFFLVKDNEEISPGPRGYRAAIHALTLTISSLYKIHVQKNTESVQCFSKK